MQQPFLTGKQPILTGVLFLFLIPITKLYSSIWTQSSLVESVKCCKFEMIKLVIESSLKSGTIEL